MAPLGEFETLVLLAVLHLGQEASAPSVRTEIERRARRPVARGAVYVTLDRLEAKRLLTSDLVHGLHGLHGSHRLPEGPRSPSSEESEPVRGGRPRRFYRVSTKGLRAVKRALDAVERMRAGLEPLLERV